MILGNSSGPNYANRALARGLWVPQLSALSTCASRRQSVMLADGRPGAAHDTQHEREPWMVLQVMRERWAKPPRMVFAVDVQVCPRCGGVMRIVGWPSRALPARDLARSPRCELAAPSLATLVQHRWRMSARLRRAAAVSGGWLSTLGAQVAPSGLLRCADPPVFRRCRDRVGRQ